MNLENFVLYLEMLVYALICSTNYRLWLSRADENKTLDSREAALLIKKGWFDYVNVDFTALPISLT